MTGRGVTVVVVDDGVEHTIKDIQPNYVSACAGWRQGSVTGACESSESSLRRHLGRKVPAANLSWEILYPGLGFPCLCATHGKQLASL